ncbi:putative C6 transcription factor [Aspergillus mulundensis]|uniref:Putative Zn(II)2Cys6 transcription factor n=1 Tax=Aspergillus mulundensis TaxID=1810919 RepID=A0A3D8SWP1_9EURO|nr:putative Zn(II)2Cys6 transcription factor [Aspergillus mulundensis]RDW90725.1 putative Zn(II)2Cys6 transcription factor [Aspergillus mulundensis]
MRRKIAAQKAQGDLERYQKLLWDLLRYLRTANDEKVYRVLETIRNGGDVENMEKDIAMIIQAASAEGLPIEDTAMDASEARKDSRISVEGLCDSPLFQVPCKPWTNVSNDDHLISGLVSLYFTWDHPLMQVVDQEMFLRDMSAGDLSSELCCPALVNSILAVASTYSPYPEVYAVPGDVASRGQHFFEEAEIRWKAEEGRPSLANIQALALMSHYLNLQGKDNASWLYIRQAVQLGQDIGLFNLPKSGHGNWDRLPDRIRHSSARTAWSLFVLNSQLSLESRKSANLGVPRLSLDQIAHHERDMVWVPYHSRSSDVELLRKPALLRDVMIRLVDLTETVVEMQDLFFEKAFDLSMSIDEMCKEADGLHGRLQAFLDRVVITETPPVPQVLFLHVKCNQVIIKLFDFLSEQRNFETSIEPSAIEQAKMARIRAAIQVAHYLQVYREHYELQLTPSLMFGPAKCSALTLLPFLNDELAYNAFNELDDFLTSFSLRFPVAKATKCEIDAFFRDSNLSSPFDFAGTADRRNSDSS